MRNNRAKNRRRNTRFRKVLDLEKSEPLAGMANLFDIGMVFAVALILALVTRYNLPKLLKENKDNILKKQTDSNIKKKNKVKLKDYKKTKKSLGGDGKKLGVCYQLKTGEIVYIPEE